ncbi:MAG: alpha-glucan family phosphorylase [Holophagales bacterium]|nr:alpha-glucan family phosphorylase [Holophagales bacterium]
MLSRQNPLLRIPCLPVADIELPDALAGLYELAYNFRWSWCPEVQDLFDRIDSPAWERYRNPVQFLINVEPHRWPPLLESEAFQTAYESALLGLRQYLERTSESWFWSRHPDFEGGPVAYFSMEYGLHASLPIYSGGLGILSGDHCKSTSDLGVPLVAVGLAYGHGYFRQTIDFEGIQQHFYPRYDFARLGLRPVQGPTGKQLRVRVPVYGREIQVRTWLTQVGRVPVLLLDTDVPENRQSDRPITQTLYVRGREMRLLQEMVLGLGGVKVLHALGIAPEAWHLNEGHVSLLQVERMAALLGHRGNGHSTVVDPAGSGNGFDTAAARVSADSLFTNHTPVPAGNEVYDLDLARAFLQPLADELGVETGRLLELGDARREDPGFNLTAFGMRTSQRSNAVSVLNTEVTNAMWGHLDLPGPRPEGKPILPVTNGVHVATWLGHPVRRLFERYVGEDWDERLLEPEAWAVLETLPDAELWQARQAQKERLARFCRSRWQRHLARHGQAPPELEDIGRLLDTNGLVIGFARRFATYKRAGLFFHDFERLERLLHAADRPVQIIYAGKAHPADRPGQGLIRQIFELGQSDAFRGKVFFLEDYDMRIGYQMVQGCDIWLNTPRRPMEASGTSGQKAAMNGALNLSILDGWWPEGYDGTNGWAIDFTDTGELTEQAQDEHDAAALYNLLEKEIVPAYYERDDDGLPREWLRRVKRAMATVTPAFSSHRMIRDYVEEHYLPAIESGRGFGHG